MKLFLDNRIVRSLSETTLDMEAIKRTLMLGDSIEIGFGWPTLLEFLGLGDLFKKLPAFNQTEPIFNAYYSTLSSQQEEEVLFYLYDTLFAECLTQIKGLPEINAVFLLNAIKVQSQKTSFLQIEKLFSPALCFYEKLLKENASKLLHDMILYLAWDRMCVYISRLFDCPQRDENYIKNIHVLKNCLVESFQHITKDGRTQPGFYRLAEALFFYYMREESLQLHPESEWVILSQSVSSFKAQDELADFLYIDQAVVLKEVGARENDDCYLTLDNLNEVNIREGFANCIMDKLLREYPHWNYELQKKKIVSING